MINLRRVPLGGIKNLGNKFFMCNLNSNSRILMSLNNKKCPPIPSLYFKNRYFLNNDKKQPDPTPKNPNQQPQTSPPQQQPKPPKFNPQQQITAQQQALINSHKPNQTFNILLNLQQNHNFQKDLIIARKIYERSTKQLRANILFQDLLKSQIQILMYDTKSKPYFHIWMKNLFNILFFCMTVWFIESLANMSDKNRVIFQRTTSGVYLKNIMYFLSGWILVIGFFRYLRFQRRFVEKIIYDTKSQNFIMVKRGFFGGRYNQEVSRFKIVYTENQFLNKKGTNYFNIDNQDQYSIPFKDAWIKQDLFSHLIAQRIKI